MIDKRLEICQILKPLSFAATHDLFFLSWHFDGVWDQNFNFKLGFRKAKWLNFVDWWSWVIFGARCTPKDRSAWRPFGLVYNHSMAVGRYSFYTPSHRWDPNFYHHFQGLSNGLKYTNILAHFGKSIRDQMVTWVFNLACLLISQEK